MIFYLLNMTICFSVKTHLNVDNVHCMVFCSNRNWMFLSFGIFIKPVSIKHFTMFKAHVYFFLFLQDFI